MNRGKTVSLGKMPARMRRGEIRYLNPRIRALLGAKFVGRGPTPNRYDGIHTTRARSYSSPREIPRMRQRSSTPWKRPR